MDCDTARDLFAFRRPGGPSELAPDDLAALDRHLAGCPACATVARRQDGFDAAVATVMTAVPVPTGLHGRLVRRVAARRAAGVRRRLFSYAAAAAALLLAVGLGYGVRRATQPILNPEEFARQQDQTAEGPDVAVADWLRRQKLPAELPLPVDFRNYAFHGTQPVMGRDVPVVVFQVWRPNQSRPDTLKLFLFRADEFRFADLQPAPSSWYTAQVVADDRKRSGVVYLALFNTADLSPFLVREVSPPVG